MGNSCFANTSNYFKKHLDICLDENESYLKVEEKIYEENNSNTQIHNLKNYFNQSEKEIIDKLNNENKINMSNQKYNHRKSVFINYIDNNKYETMLKKLLEQKNIERRGPKRRETIRNKNQIEPLVKEVLKEKNSKKNEYKKQISKKSHLKRDYSLIIKGKEKSRLKQTLTIKRKDSNTYKNLNKSLKDHYLKISNTLNEILTEGNRSSIINKKETNKI